MVDRTGDAFEQLLSGLTSLMPAMLDGAAEFPGNVLESVVRPNEGEYGCA
jgi:hypothetical protein